MKRVAFALQNVTKPATSKAERIQTGFEDLSNLSEDAHGISNPSRNCSEMHFISQPRDLVIEQSKRCEMTNSKNNDGLGKLQFSVDYNYHKSQLCVCLLRAKNLPAMDTNGTCDPFVKILLLPDESSVKSET